MTRNCACHDRPVHWVKDDRYRAGGFWRCTVNTNAQKRDRYDRDPIYRIEKNLHDYARKRRATLERQRLALSEERETDGPL